MNAKELILKKINADTNWVDIYTSGVILGEDINAIGDFMTSQVINDLVSKYNTSAFDTEYVGTKIDFIRKAIASETDNNKIVAYNELLRRVYIAEELRIMGKILKINQGMPTNFSDLQQYISSIEEYIESRLNHVNLENYQNTISQFSELKKQLGLSEELTKEEMNIPEVANALKQIKKAKEQMTSKWIYFNLVKFVQEKEYAQQMDAMYEGVKVTFNILNTLRNSPHFSEMFNVLGLNNTILTSLSKRNLIERTIWNNTAHKSSRGQKVIYKKLNSTERSTLKTLVDDTLVDTWIKTNIRNSDGNPVRIIWTANEKSNIVTFDGGFDYKLFIKYIETELIPRLRNNGLIVNGRTINTADNAFIKHLTFGKDRDGNTIFRLPYNMTQIDKNSGIQMEYEKILSAFGQLRGVILDNGLSIVDMFYLYNLIIHKDKINSRYSLTRLFEDLIASDGGKQLLVFKFNEWLEKVNEEEIINKVLGKWGAVHSNDNIGNSNTSYSSLVITPKFDADKTATIKARSSNKFIGFGPEGGSTYYYAQQAGSSANTGDYTAEDVIFVSVPGKRGDAQIRKQYQDQTIREAIKALEAGATLITDSAEYLATSDYNEGEQRLAQNLQYLGYQYETVFIDGYQIGKWTNPKNTETTHKSESKTVKYTPKGQSEQTYTIIGNKIFNSKGEEVYADENNGHRQLIFVELALQENRVVKVEYRNVTYVVNSKNQIFSTSSNKIVYQNENDGNRRVILERAKEEFAKLQNSSKMIDINSISTKTEAFGVVFPKQGKTSQALKSEYQQWQIDNPTGIVAYRFKFYNTVEKVQLGHIGNPFSENTRGANTVQQFYDWLVTGNNFGNEKATDEYRRAIISKLLSTPTNSPILYYTELGRPSHATVLGYLIANKQLLSNQSSPKVEIYQGRWTRAEVESKTDKVFLFGDNTDDRVNTHYIPTRTQAVIRGLPNAIGIDTKKNRGTSENSYFTDADFDIFKAQVDEAIQRAIDSGKTIVIPADGIGTGKAELDKRAPKLFAYLQQKLDELKSLSSSSPVQLTLNFGENDDPERFNTAEESVAVLESPKTILSNSELQLWSHVTNPKILVASEHSDPAFHTKKILEVINGTRNVTDWKGDTFTGNQFDGLYIITKHDGLPIRKLLETKIPKLIHFSITTLGGTKYEPGVMKYNDLLDRIAEYIKLGLDPNTITIRIDPIVPGETKWEDIETVMRRSAEMGIKRIKFSIMDAYPNTIKAMTELGYNFETYYETKTNLTVNGQYKFHAKESVQKDFATRMLQLAQKYNLELHTCAEPLVLPGILHEGCLSVNAVNEMLGTHIEDKGYDNNKSRQLCSCFGGKIDVLKYGDNCASHCIYCYAKHENDRAMQYYNEDGTLKRNAFTDIYWNEQFDNVDVIEESVAEELVTIGFGNTDERADNETDEIVDIVEEIEEEQDIVLNSEQKNAVEGIVSHLKSRSMEPILLNGKAGTGKTTIVAEILKQLPPYQTIWVGAITHKACGVLFNKLRDSQHNIKKKTVASMTSKYLDMRSGDFVEGDSWARDNGEIPPSIIFIDEASMVSTDDYNKLLDYAQRNGVKLVFIGDDGQLPPVEKKSSESPIFKLQTRFNLVERVRQGEDSPILPYSDGYWNFSHSNGMYPLTTPKNIINNRGAVVFSKNTILRSQETIDLFKTAVSEKRTNLVKIITWTNEVRKGLNQYIHERLFGNKNRWAKGEIIIFYDSLKQGRELLAENSSEWYIESLGNIRKHFDSFGDFSFSCNVQSAVLSDGERKIEAMLFATAEDQESWKQYWTEQLKVVREKFDTNPKKYTQIIRRIYNNLNSIANIDYAYAITCHKSQGSTYDISFVTSEIHNNSDFDFKSKWLYTAITRARNVVVMIHGDGSYNDSIYKLNETIENNKSLKPDTSLHIDLDYIAEREEILRNAPRNSEGQLLAPNGKVSKLSEEQWVTVRTKAFKEWFGDWEQSAIILESISYYIESGDILYLLPYETANLFFKNINTRSNARSIINSIFEEIKKSNNNSDLLELIGVNLQSKYNLSKKIADKLISDLLDISYYIKSGDPRYLGVKSSLVVDYPTYEPKVVYHHTDNPNLTKFSTDFPNYFSQSKGGTKKAIFFDENISGTLGRKYDIPVFLNIRNLTTYVGTKEDLHKKGTDYTTVVNESAARDERFGGLHMSKFDDNKLLNQDVWIIHDAHNVKSATGAHEFTSSPNIYDADPTPVYQITPSKQSKLIEVVRQANEKGIKGLHVVYQSDLVNENIYIRSANGFVRNGEIYINVDRAGDDTVIHEFGHLYLADAKNNNRLAYYALLEKVKDTELWKRMKTWTAYANKVGSDFDEEILATMIGEYYKSGFENYEYESLVKEALELVDPAFIELLNSEILPDLGDTFITNYHFQQKVATWKSKLVSDNILKENCL